MSASENLYSLAHQLLTLGMDGTPIYSDRFARLNREVYEQALELHNLQPGSTPEEEASLCLAMLVAFNATVYDDGRKHKYIQEMLNRSWKVLPNLAPSLLKVRLLVYCYSECYDEALVKEAHEIIDTWDKAGLNLEQGEVVEMLRGVEENPGVWEEVGE